jgi:hypothetical protein
VQYGLHRIVRTNRVTARQSASQGRGRSLQILVSKKCSKEAAVLVSKSVVVPSHGAYVVSLPIRHNMSVNMDARERPLPVGALRRGRQLPLRYVSASQS